MSPRYGKNNYFMLREVALRHCSLTFFLNGAELCAPPRAANLQWCKTHDWSGGTQLSWRILSDVAEGAELIEVYGFEL